MPSRAEGPEERTSPSPASNVSKVSRHTCNVAGTKGECKEIRVSVVPYNMFEIVEN